LRLAAGGPRPRAARRRTYRPEVCRLAEIYEAVAARVVRVGLNGGERTIQDSFELIEE
jgi:hypothetical protein